MSKDISTSTKVSKMYAICLSGTIGKYGNGYQYFLHSFSRSKGGEPDWKGTALKKMYRSRSTAEVAFVRCREWIRTHNTPEDRQYMRLDIVEI